MTVTPGSEGTGSPQDAAPVDAGPAPDHSNEAQHAAEQKRQEELEEAHRVHRERTSESDAPARKV